MIEAVASWFTPTVLFCVLNLMIGTIFISSSLKTDNKRQQHQLTRTQSLLHRVNSVNLSFPYPFSSDDSPQLDRSPSLLQRVKSINLSFSRLDRSDPFDSATRLDDPVSSPQLDRSPSLLQRVRSINLSFSRLDRPERPPTVTRFSNRSKEQTRPDPTEEQTRPDPLHAATRFPDPTEEQTHVTRSVSDTCVEAVAKVPRRMMEKSVSERKMGEEKAAELDRRMPETTREATSFGEDEAVDKKADDFINKFRQQLKLQRIDSILRYKEMLNRGVGK